jgi:predicted nucleotidyltransferase
VYKGDITEKILEVCKTLNSNNVEYLVVGGSAVAFHGYFRWSIDKNGLKAEKFDLDFWYNPTYKNYFNLLNALADLGQDVVKFKKEQTPEPKKSFFRFNMENITVDFLPQLNSITTFRKSFSKRETVKINEIEISVLHIDDLIAEKELLNRPKDILDISELKKLRKD